MSEGKLIPDVFVQHESSGDHKASSDCDTERQGGSVTGSLEESDGFIPIPELTLDKLPESIRSTDNLAKILDVAKHVVAINNNGTSLERPPNFQLGKKLQGTGFIFLITQELWSQNEEKKEHLAVVSTNRHVLYNDEEVKKSTIDIFYDEPMAVAYKSGRIRRTARGRGLGTLRSNQEEDFTLAVFSFSDDVMAHIADLTFAKEKFPVLLHQLQTSNTVEGASQDSVVCVISHPLGQPKQVSFGQLLEHDVAKRSLRHSAPTRVGSSGAPLLIFSPAPPAVPPNSIWYHTAAKSTTKFGGLQVNDSRLFQMNLNILDEATVHYSPSLLREFVRFTNLNLEETLSNIYGAVKENTLIKAVASNVSFLSCLGSVVLQPATFLTSLSVDDLHPCQPLEESVVKAAVEHGGEDVSNAVKVLRTVSPGLLPSDLEQSLDPRLLSQFLLDQGPCYCRDIFAALQSRPDCKAGLSFFHPLSTPVDASREPSWPFQFRSENSNHGISDTCYARGMLQGLLVSERSITEFMSFLPPLLVLMEANKTVRKSAKSRMPPSESAREREWVGNTDLNDRQHVVLKLLMFFVDWGLNAVNMFTRFWWLTCSLLQGLLPMALTASVAIDDELEEEILYTGQRSRNTEPPTKSRLVTVEDLEAFDDMKRLLSHATMHGSQDHRDAPRLPTVEPCKCGRPLMADMIEASVHLQRVLQEQAHATEQGEAEVKLEQDPHVKFSTADGSMQETSPLQTQVSEQGKALSSTGHKQPATRTQLAHVQDSSDVFNRAPTPSQRHQRPGSTSSISNDDDLSLPKVGSNTTQGCFQPVGSSADASDQPIEKEQDTREEVSEVSVDASAKLMAGFRDALQGIKNPLDPDFAKEETGQLWTSGNKHGDSGDRATSVNRSVPDERGSGNSRSGDNGLPCWTSSVSSSVSRSTAGHIKDNSSNENGQDKVLDSHSVTESERNGASKVDEYWSPPCKNNSQEVTDQKLEADEEKGNEEHTIRNLDDLLLAYSEAITSKSAAASVTFMSTMAKTMPQVQTLRTSPREARLSEELAERFRVALLSTPVSHRDALAAVEVLHYDCPRFLTLCHRILGCSCDAHTTAFIQDVFCEAGDGAAKEKVSLSEDTGAVTSENGSNQDGVLASLLQMPASFIKEKFATVGRSLHEQVEDVSTENKDDSTSDGSAGGKPVSSRDSDVTAHGAEEKRSEDPQHKFSTQSLKVRLLDELQKNPDRSHFRILLEEDCLQAYSDMLVYAASEKISEENLLVSFRRAQLVASYCCRNAMKPLQGVEALALNLLEKIKEHSVRGSRPPEQ